MQGTAQNLKYSGKGLLSILHIYKMNSMKVSSGKLTGGLMESLIKALYLTLPCGSKGKEDIWTYTPPSYKVFEWFTD